MNIVNIKMSIIYSYINNKYGLDSYNDKILRIAEKGYTTEDIGRAIKLAKEYEIPTQISFIYGLPGETPETAQRNYEFAKEIVKDPNIVMLISSMLIPFAGTEIFENLRRAEYGYLLNSDEKEVM